MQKPINSRVPAMTASLFAFAFALHSGGLLAASDCLDQPNRAAAQGGHWYYHVDRATGRKCWHLTETEPTAGPSQAQISPQPAPEPAQPPALSSFFSSLTSGFTTASTGAPQKDSATRDARGMAIVQPEPPKGDDAAPKGRQRADAKPAPQSKPDRQASSRSAKAAADQPHPVSLDQAERDALFRDYLRWKERQ
jgi:hypothetical protein